MKAVVGEEALSPEDLLYLEFLEVRRGHLIVDRLRHPLCLMTTTLLWVICAFL